MLLQRSISRRQRFMSTPEPTLPTTADGALARCIHGLCRRRRAHAQRRRRAQLAADGVSVPDARRGLLARHLPRLRIAGRLLESARGARGAWQGSAVLRLARPADLRLAAAIDLRADHQRHNLRWMRLRASLHSGRAVAGDVSRPARARLVVERSLCVALVLGLVPASQVIAGLGRRLAVRGGGAAGARRILYRRNALASAPGAVSRGFKGGFVGQWMLGLALMVVERAHLSAERTVLRRAAGGALIARRRRGLQGRPLRWAVLTSRSSSAALGLAYCP